jgi:hypothetical protein
VSSNVTSGTLAYILKLCFYFVSPDRMIYVPLSHPSTPVSSDNSQSVESHRMLSSNGYSSFVFGTFRVQIPETGYPD